LAGVFGLRAAAVLIDNLCASATGAPMRAYRPHRRWLAIIDLDDGTALAMRGRLWWAGRLALRLKRRLDLGFVTRNRA
jgi:NADH dehydrogenase FAD-containing subunit